jgi:hypothetical protein
VSRGDTPVVPGVVYGLREWDVRFEAAGPRLDSLFQQAGWRAGPGAVTTASCAAGRSHRAPHASCGCGLYALHPDPGQCRTSFEAASRAATSPAPSAGARVAGIVAAWGQVELHDTGFRAEHARPHLFVLPRRAHQGYAQTVYALAAAHGAEVLEVGSGGELHRHCAEHDLGLGEAALERLLGERVGAERRRAERWTRVERVREALAPAISLLGLLLLNPISLIFLISLAVARLDGGEALPRSPAPHVRAVRVLEQRVVRVDGEDLYVALVRNPSRSRTALDVHPLGRFLGRRGRYLGRPSVLADNRPSLAPGQTGVVFDLIEERRSVAHAVDRLRVRAHAHRMVRGVAHSPVRVARVRLDHRRCIATAYVWSDRRRLRADLAAIARDRRGRIVNAGWWVAGPLPRGWSRQVVGRLSPETCARPGLTGEAHPNLTVDELRRPGR